ncbi:MAG TPA: tryptophan dimethylallyltransferase family protein [Myxococcaceae bacterium]|nr:tryptophan dimethylallyltransferase family protein [Myxococcaceae bacterium]
MSRVQEHVKEKQLSFAGSPLMSLLQDMSHSAEDRLSFLPCLSPLVMGLSDLGSALLGVDTSGKDGRNEAEGRNWAVFRKDLQALGLDTSSDLSGMVQLVWGEDSSEARRLLYGLINQAMDASPLMRQVILMAVQAVANLALPVAEQVANELQRRGGARLTSISHLRRRLDVGPWAVGEVELDLLPGMEQEAVKTIDEVFTLFTDLADQLQTFCERKIERRQQQLRWELLTKVERTSNLSFLEFGLSRIQALCSAVGFSAPETQKVEEFFSFMTSPWSTRLIGEASPWRSDVTDDHTPYELSLALEGGRPEIRFLMESQRKNGATTLQSSWDDGIQLNERLQQHFGVPMDRFKQVEDLFEPRNPTARFSLWHAFCLKPNGQPEFKVYLNPKARGVENSKLLVKEALTRLGFTNAWRFLSEVAMRRGAKDQLVYFSLDLSGQKVSRVKIYVAHTDANAEDIEAVMSQAKEYVPGEALAFCERLQKEGRFNGMRSTLTCLAFTSDDDARPYSVTLHCPIRCYVEHDGESLRRLSGVLTPQNHAALDRAVKAMARRPLESAVGLIQWASMRREGGQVRTTFYLATEAYGIVVPRTVPRAAELTQLSA